MLRLDAYRRLLATYPCISLREGHVDAVRYEKYSDASVCILDVYMSLLPSLRKGRLRGTAPRHGSEHKGARDTQACARDVVEYW